MNRKITALTIIVALLLCSLFALFPYAQAASSVNLPYDFYLNGGDYFIPATTPFTQTSLDLSSVTHASSDTTYNFGYSVYVDAQVDIHQIDSSNSVYIFATGTYGLSNCNLDISTTQDGEIVSENVSALATLPTSYVVTLANGNLTVSADGAVVFNYEYYATSFAGGVDVNGGKNPTTNPPLDTFTSGYAVLTVDTSLTLPTYPAVTPDPDGFNVDYRYFNHFGSPFFYQVDVSGDVPSATIDFTHLIDATSEEPVANVVLGCDASHFIFVGADVWTPDSIAGLYLEFKSNGVYNPGTTVSLQHEGDDFSTYHDIVITVTDDEVNGTQISWDGETQYVNWTTPITSIGFCASTYAWTSGYVRVAYNGEAPAPTATPTVTPTTHAGPGPGPLSGNPHTLTTSPTLPPMAPSGFDWSRLPNWFFPAILGIIVTMAMALYLLKKK